MLKGMRLMHVNERFIKEHFKIAGVPEGENSYTRYNSWEVYLTWRPVVAMILEGDDAVDKVRQLTLNEESSLFWDDGPTSYISKSAPEASRDIELWFRKDSEGWLNEMIGSKDLIYVHPDKSHGPWESAFEMLRNDVMCDPQPDLQQYCTMAEMSVLVIKPKAFDEYCVGEILKAFEFSSFEVRGLKVVRKAECPETAVWSCETDSNAPALAIVANFLSPKFGFTHDKPDAEDIDFSSEVYRVGSNYIYKSEVDTLCRDMTDFFPYGLVLWVDPECDHVCGNMFEASLIGLKTQD
ncbi:uncharacterized protein LOC113302585 [Papaver somniferum]|uniref:uncharacterized protein LOC113302585 n=1 Tax=Papaver somniferum TaxID=3469 RepID=UPI000E6FCFD1|nr:uncharacterized protein LOC113302585 [Papaver somniferum]